MDVVLTRVKVRAGKEGQAKAWLAYLAGHTAEGNATLAREGARVESWFATDEADGLWVSCYAIVGDTATQERAFAGSTLEIDRGHKRFIRECLDPATYVETRAAAHFGDYSAA